MKLSVLDFATTKEAFDRARDGDRIYFPGRYVGYPAPSGGFRVNRSLQVFGDGMCDNGEPTGSVVYGEKLQHDPPYDPPLYGDAFVVDVPASNPAWPVHFHDFKISACLNGFLCQVPSGKSLQSLTAERVNVFNAREFGFRLEGFSASYRIESVGIVACVASIAPGTALKLKFVRSARVIRSTFIDNRQYGIRCENSSVALYNTGCDNSQHLGDDVTHVGQYPIEDQMLFSSCIAVLVDGCAFESFQFIHQTTPPAPPIYLGAGVACEFLSTKVAQIAGSFFYTGGSTPTITGILASGAVSGPVVVMPNRYERVAGWMVDVKDEVLDCVILAQFDRVNQEDYSGAMHVPAASGGNGGCCGVPFERRPSVGDTRRGLIVPSGTAAVTDLRDGMLYLAVSTGNVMGRVGALWKTIQTD